MTPRRSATTATLKRWKVHPPLKTGVVLPDYIEGFIYDDKIDADGTYVKVGEITHVWDEGRFYTVITTSRVYRLWKEDAEL